MCLLSKRELGFEGIVRVDQIKKLKTLQIPKKFVFSRRGRLRVLHGELSRALTFGLFVARRPLREPLLSSHFRPLRCQAEASAAGALSSWGMSLPPQSLLRPLFKWCPKKGPSYLIIGPKRRKAGSREAALLEQAEEPSLHTGHQTPLLA